MEPPLDAEAVVRVMQTRARDDAIDSSAVILPAAPLVAGETPPTPRDVIASTDSTARPEELRTATWSVACAGCRAAGSPWAARRPWPAWWVGAGWSRGATRAGCPGRSAACWSSTSDVARGLFRPSRLSPQFPRSAARMPRVNGTIGLDANLDPARWRLQVIGSAGEHSPRSFTLDQIKAFPRVEMTTELRCIEGWSDVVHWAGARLADLASVTGLATRGGRPLGYAGAPDTRRRVLRRARHGQRPPSSDLALLRDGRPASDPRARRTAPAGHPGQVRHQEPQADRNHQSSPTIGPPTTGPNEAMTGMRDTETRRHVHRRRLLSSCH